MTQRSLRRPMAGYAGLVLLCWLATPALAGGIVCRDGYQRVNGADISTPYCRDNHLAEIARRRGARVTAAEIRNNPGTKAEICRWIGGSIPAQDYCNGDDDDVGDK